MSTKESLSLQPVGGASPEIGRWLAAYDDARRRTLKLLESVDTQAVNWNPEDQSSIGSILYHVAAIEASWLYDEVLGNQWPENFDERFPYPVRADGQHITPVPDESLEAHLSRLDAVHADLIAAYRAMTLDEFRRARETPDYTVTPEWVLHHLMQHEAEHRAEIGSVWQQAKRVGTGV